MSIYQASRLLGINNATAKDIVRKYRREGTVFIRKAELKKIETEDCPSSHENLLRTHKA
jgi:transposase